MQSFTTRFTAGWITGISLTIAGSLAFDIGGLMTAIQSII